MHSSVFNLLVHVCKIMIRHTWFVMPAVDSNIDGDCPYRISLSKV